MYLDLDTLFSLVVYMYVKYCVLDFLEGPPKKIGFPQ